jgi:hypothetical protein
MFGLFGAVRDGVLWAFRFWEVWKPQWAVSYFPNQTELQPEGLGGD